MEKNNIQNKYGEIFSQEIDDSFIMSQGEAVLSPEKITLPEYIELVNNHCPSNKDFFNQSLNKNIQSINESSDLLNLYPEDTTIQLAIIPYTEHGNLLNDDTSPFRLLILSDDKTVDGFNSAGLPNRIHKIIPKELSVASFKIPGHNSIPDIKSYLINKLQESYSKLFNILSVN